MRERPPGALLDLGGDDPDRVAAARERLDDLERAREAAGPLVVVLEPVGPVALEEGLHVLGAPRERGELRSGAASRSRRSTPRRVGQRPVPSKACRTAARMNGTVSTRVPSRSNRTAMGRALTGSRMIVQAGRRFPPCVPRFSA